MKTIIFIFISFLLLFLSLFIAGWLLFGPPGDSSQTITFIVPQNKTGFNVAKSLLEQKLIRNESAFQFLLDHFALGKDIKSGGYRLNQKMNARQVLSKITGNPDLLWFTISFCARKEQVGEKLAAALGWDQNKLNTWNTLYQNDQTEYFEGVYYPDTYLLPTDESPEQIAKRLIDRFNEKFAPLADKFMAKNIKWTTGLKIASLIAREAAGPEDMKLISGIIWNRLNIDMRLQIDATMQYTIGKKINGSWWGTVDLDEKQSDSPYNTYRHEGLPPTPICSPDITAIEATLNPEETDCLYYLHDKYKQIHCAKTFLEHKANIREYLY